MKKETYKDMQKDSVYLQAVVFIKMLLKGGVKLDDIMTNDWHCNYSPSVYLLSRRYRRLSGYDANNAISYYNRF